MNAIFQAHLNSWRKAHNVPVHWLEVSAAAKRFYCAHKTITKMCPRLQAKGHAVRSSVGSGFWIVDPNALEKHFTAGIRKDAIYAKALEWINNHCTESTYWPINDLVATIQAIDPKATPYAIRHALELAGINRASAESIAFRQSRRVYVLDWLNRHPWILLECPKWQSALIEYARWDDEHPAGFSSTEIPRLTFKYYIRLASQAVFS